MERKQKVVVLNMGFAFKEGNESIDEVNLFDVFSEADNDFHIIDHYPNILKLTFDGKTKKLISAEVIS